MTLGLRRIYKARMMGLRATLCHSITVMMTAVHMAMMVLKLTQAQQCQDWAPVLALHPGCKDVYSRRGAAKRFTAAQPGSIVFGG